MWDSFHLVLRWYSCCSKENPAASCQEIYTKDAKAVSGAYWIKGKLRPFQVSIRLTGQTILLKGAVSRQSSSFCLILPITSPSIAMELKVSNEITGK